RGGKYTVDSNAAMGWPTSPYWAAGMGMGLLSAGVGTMMGGVGAGGYGCGGAGFGPGSAFFNPYAQNPFLGGGMWQPGMNGMLNGMLNPFGSMYNPMDPYGMMMGGMGGMGPNML